MAGPYGTAWDVAGDIDPTFRSLTSQQAGDLVSRKILANAIVRTLDTPPGSSPDAPGRGYDLQSLLLRALTRDELDSEGALMEAQIALDERVQSVSVSVEQDRTASGVRAIITVDVVPDLLGPFKFTVRASELALEVSL